jgi:hypothetical protein
MERSGLAKRFFIACSAGASGVEEIEGAVRARERRAGA